MSTARKQRSHARWINTVWPDRYRPQPPECPRPPHPGERRLSTWFPRLIDQQRDLAALSHYTSQWEAQGWQVFATMAIGEFGTAVHMGRSDAPASPAAVL